MGSASMPIERMTPSQARILIFRLPSSEDPQERESLAPEPQEPQRESATPTPRQPRLDTRQHTVYNP